MGVQSIVYCASPITEQRGNKMTEEIPSTETSEDFSSNDGQTILTGDSVRLKVFDESPTLRKAYARWAHMHPKAIVIPIPD
jgi:hypothetical protein